MIRKPRLSKFAATLEREWRKLLLPIEGHTIVVGVSGGADSTALLLALQELIHIRGLSLRIVAAHLDHRLRKNSKDDAAWVSELCKKLGFTAVIRATNVRKRATEKGENLEQAARIARYAFFTRVARDHKAEVVLTAHTLDDQAETVLLRLLRGAAAEGLSGIEPVRLLEMDSNVRVARPLLTWARREETQSYCRARGIAFREDEMNEDERFARVKVRKQLLPIMKEFNNRIVETLGRTAMLLREDAQALSHEAELLRYGAEVSRTTLDVGVLQTAPMAVRRRAVRSWIRDRVGNLKRVEMVHLLAVERLVLGNRGGTVELPNGVRVTRRRKVLSLDVKTVEKRGSGV
ncbi:MAG TPA: tRNA lysidine(34) synthetase TilS [Pyrinomonadaceae bacterium]|nr:tRNA lysidine(34) synthetase TilS [Pyrinomonadaceae bacterium]